LRDGDPSVAAGIAQRRPGGEPVMLTTPALQTNFSPASVAYWREVYRDMAQVMQEAGLGPYLQFGEVQWWYFRDGSSGMPYYDAYTQAEFYNQYGRAMGLILENTAHVADFPDEAAFLPTLIGAFTNQVMAYVRQTYADCRFEALYPLDVNEPEFNHAVNYPAATWTPATLDCLKTESFGYTSSHQTAHLVGVSGPSVPWMKEVSLALADGVESVTLWALDQYCLMGATAGRAVGGGRSGWHG
jgi:hypothetical protein